MPLGSLGPSDAAFGEIDGTGSSKPEEKDWSKKSVPLSRVPAGLSPIWKLLLDQHLLDCLSKDNFRVAG